jgi:hypothetical protein
MRSSPVLPADTEFLTNATRNVSDTTDIVSDPIAIQQQERPTMALQISRTIKNRFTPNNLGCDKSPSSQRLQRRHASEVTREASQTATAIPDRKTKQVKLP